MSGVSRRLTSKHTGPAVKRNVRHCPGQKPHRRSRSGWVTSAGLESVGHEVEEAEGDRADEGAPVHHSMIWSARTRMDCGIVRPRAFAVWRLITSSNFVTCSTGCAFHLFVLSASCRPPQVFVMQSTDARHLHHSALTRQLHSPRLGGVF